MKGWNETDEKVIKIKEYSSLFFFVISLIVIVAICWDRTDRCWCVCKTMVSRTPGYKIILVSWSICAIVLHCSCWWWLWIWVCCMRCSRWDLITGICGGRWVRVEVCHFGIGVRIAWRVCFCRSSRNSFWRICQGFYSSTGSITYIYLIFIVLTCFWWYVCRWEFCISSRSCFSCFWSRWLHWIWVIAIDLAYCQRVSFSSGSRGCRFSHSSLAASSMSSSSRFFTSGPCCWWCGRKAGGSTFRRRSIWYTGILTADLHLFAWTSLARARFTKIIRPRQTIHKLS